MRNRVKYIFYLLIVALFTTGCKTPYTPAPTTAVTNYLVVEGLINISDSTYIKLSRTVNISSAATTKPELKATITIESNAGNSYALTELGKGTYAAPAFNLSAANQYRLRIKTANGSQYVSDFNATMVSPPIDSITFKATTDLKIYANTHDPKNATRYYRWDFTEAWQFHSNFDSQWLSNGYTISIRTPAQQIFACYAADTSTNITLGTSAGLSQDVIRQALVNTIPADQEKIGIKYSIMVKQYALTQDAYNYWTLLQKNTEQLGSIFDAQPSASIGNIHCVNNPAEIVIGYISAGTINSNRIFITKSQLPNWVTTPFYSPLQCELDTIRCCRSVPDKPWLNEYINYDQPEFLGYSFLLIPVDEVFGPNGLPINPLSPGPWMSSTPACVDCTLRGKTAPPSFWK